MINRKDDEREKHFFEFGNPYLQQYITGSGYRDIEAKADASRNSRWNSDRNRVVDADNGRNIYGRDRIIPVYRQ